MIDCSHETKANYLWQPNDLLIITSLLQRIDKVTLIDGTADALKDTEFFQLVAEAEGDLAIIALSSVCWESDYRYFQAIRKMKAATPLFVLGDIFLEKDYRQIVLAECDGIVYNPYALDLRRMAAIRSVEDAEYDGVCLNPDQEFFSSAKRAVFVESGIPRHEVFLKKGYRFPFAHSFKFTTLTTMWGCPFSCSYCSDSRFPPVVRRAEDILKELAYIDGLGVRELFIADKTFGFFKETALPVLEEMRRTYRFSWSCYFHPQLYEPRLLEGMAAAGCHTVIVGIDSANLASLKRYGRTVDRERLEALIEHANRLKMSICADFILGLGHETEDDILNTVGYALELPIDFASFNVASPLPGSDIRRRLMEAGEWVVGKEGFDTAGRMGIVGSSRITEERLRAVRKKAFCRFYLRPGYLMKRLRKTTSLEHLLIQLLEMSSMFRKV